MNNIDFDNRYFGSCFFVTVYCDGLPFEQLLGGIRKACPKVRYLIIGKEVTSAGKLHAHCWIETTYKGFFYKDEFTAYTDKKCWVQINKTTPYKNLSYCTKNHDYIYLELKDNLWKKTSGAYSLLAMAHAQYCMNDPSSCKVLLEEEDVLTGLVAAAEAKRKGGSLRGQNARTDAESRPVGPSITSERQLEPEARERDASPCRDVSKHDELYVL